jgi:hypothetical protein
MDQPIRLVFVYQRSEYLRAMRRLYFKYRHGLHVGRDTVLACILIVLGGGYTYLYGIDTISLLLFTPGAVLVLIMGYSFFVLPRMIYASEPKLKEQYELDFSDGGMAFRMRGLNSTLEWPFYKEWLVDDEFYVLFYGKRNPTVIPRRAFSSREDDSAFRELLVRHIGNPV